MDDVRGTTTGGRLSGAPRPAPAWWRNAVIYQVYPRSFQDSNGDGVGDLEGIRRRLRYVAELGADAVWICPFVRSPMRDFGYDVSDYTAVEPVFGTMADFRRLIDAAHALDLKVITDQVFNHTSDEHPWFIESRSSRDNDKADWYVWADPGADGGPPNNWRATFGGSAWAFDEGRRQYYLHNFLGSQPDLNWYNPRVRAALLDVARYWLDLGVDGFRLDVVNFYAHDRSLRDNPPRDAAVPRPAGAAPADPYFDFVNAGTVSRPETLDCLSELRALVDRYPDRFLLGEISSAEDALAVAADFVAGPRRLHAVYNASLVTHEPFDRASLEALIRRAGELFEDDRLCWTFGTHDFPRLKGRWAAHRRHDDAAEQRLDRLLAALLVCLPGSCCIYQGDELGLTQATLSFDQLRDPYGIANYPSILGRDGCRTPIPWTDAVPTGGFSEHDTPWLPIPAHHFPLAVSRQERDAQSLLSVYRQFLAWRRRQPALAGSIEWPEVHGDDTVLLFDRCGPAQRLRCAFNLAAADALVDIGAGRWRLSHQPLLSGRLDGRRLRLPSFGAAILQDDDDAATGAA
ncbi:MAG: alpha-amylase family glycosyl hydrolase [Pseudomonadota bacterium]|nr:alpha-amylase family glycosyl hydrolase [Pseudomonadota bacterium]